MIKMEDKQIILFAVSIAILSIILLFVFIDSTKPIKISLYSTDSSKIPRNSLIEFQGKINKLTFNEKTVSIKVCDNNCLTVVANNNLEILNILSEGDLIKIKGTTKSYYQGIVVYAQEINHLG